MTANEIKYKRESDLVRFLMQRLGIEVSKYHDPNAEEGQETGVDVIAVTATCNIGLQVTELDTGSVPGQSRGKEKIAAREAENQCGGVYFSWAQNDQAKVLEAIVRTISRKSVMTPVAKVDEVWLLISCGVPELGAVVSTFIMTSWVDVAALNTATLSQLSKSKYSRVFLHAVLGVNRDLYQWSPSLGSWEKTTQLNTPGTQGPFPLDVIKDKEWLEDPEGKCAGEVEKLLREIREGKMHRAGE
jgi:hypothetical protein